MQATATAQPDVLADLLYPRKWAQSFEARIAREAILTVGFAGFVALCAQIVVRLSFTTVPITGQTFAVLVTGGALGAWRGAGALTIYMVAGFFMPVLAPAAPSALVKTSSVHFILPWSGVHAFPWDITSGGYIVGFILAAFIVGWFAQKGWDRKPGLPVVSGMLLSNALLYVPGLLWLGYLISSGWVHPVAQKPLADLITYPGGGAINGSVEKTMVGGLYPFILGDLIKLGLAALVLPGAWGLVQRFRKG